MSRFAINVLLGGGVRVRIRVQRKFKENIKGTTKPLMAILDSTPVLMSVITLASFPVSSAYFSHVGQKLARSLSTEVNLNDLLTQSRLHGIYQHAKNANSTSTGLPGISFPPVCNLIGASLAVSPVPV